MNLKPWTAAAVLTGLSLLAAPVAHAAASDAGVVRVDGCAASKATSQLTFVDIFGKNVSQMGMPAMLMVDFANESANPITAVDFGLVKDGKLVATVRDTGTFAPKARVMHAFGIEETAIPDQITASSCLPLRVQYADGTSWMNPNIPAH
jgi:hypothetical protein